MILTLSAVDYTYSPGTSFSQQALSAVSFDVSVGELVLVLGATGSGKSTLLRLLAGLLQPTSGIARLGGAPLDRDSARGVVGLVFQDAEAQLFAESVFEDVAFGPRNLGSSQSEVTDAAHAALRLVGLDPAAFGSRSPFGLSGGEARRAAIAGVLSMNPKFLLMDEPTAGLDSKGRRAVRDIVSAMRASAAVVVVSHSAEEFLDSADKVVILERGKACLLGSGADVIGDPSLLSSHGIRPPDVLQLQCLAREKGCCAGGFTLDPLAAAANLAHARGWSW